MDAVQVASCVWRSPKEERERAGAVLTPCFPIAASTPCSTGTSPSSPSPFPTDPSSP